MSALRHFCGQYPFQCAWLYHTPLETFEIEARVLASEHYAFDRGADLSPVDLVLGWGPMSDSRVLSQIQISQSQRFYYWHVDAFPIPRRDIETHSANMHMIPASGEIEDQLESVKVGQHVKISGYLVQVNAPNGFHWKSSLTREDTGAGACELVYVKTLSFSNS
ncbi:MAG: hypothetical protein SFU55_04670 [Methylophilus sp.]|nr:hypothetical protein [Methylophilus sp.]